MNLFTSKHPLWLAGFRPFFVFALVSGVFLPLLWSGIFSGKVLLPTNGLNTLQWHAHEMLFGFGWAVLGGFLLTASKNWVKVRGIHGINLMVVTGLWIMERIGMYFYGDFQPWLQWFIVNAFILYIVGYLIWTLVYFRKQDSFKDNFIFVIVLPLFILSKNAIVHPEWYAQGVGVAIGLFRVAFVVMFERTLTQFMNNSMNIQLKRFFILDTAIKFFSLASVVGIFFSPIIYAFVLGVSGLLLGLRFILWQPVKGFSNFGIGLSYFGYLALVVHFLLESLKWFGYFHPIGTISTHIFSMLCMGIVIPAMIIRIAQGHTGRSLAFTKSDRVAIVFLLIGAIFRLIITQLFNESYLVWIFFAALCWAFGFTILAWRLIPFLIQARVDGKEH